MPRGSARASAARRAGAPIPADRSAQVASGVGRTRHGNGARRSGEGQAHRDLRAAAARIRRTDIAAETSDDRPGDREAESRARAEAARAIVAARRSWWGREA